MTKRQARKREGLAKQPSAYWGSLSIALSVAALLVLLWVGMTVRSGLNYHLFPAVIAAAPAAVLNLLSGSASGRTRALVMMATGIAFVASGWAVLEALASAPTATFVDNQPGGARAEAVVLAIVGAFVGRRLFVDRQAKGD